MYASLRNLPQETLTPLHSPIRPSHFSVPSISSDRYGSDSGFRSVPKSCHLLPATPRAYIHGRTFHMRDHIFRREQDQSGLTFKRRSSTGFRGWSTDHPVFRVSTHPSNDIAFSRSVLMRSGPESSPHSRRPTPYPLESTTNDRERYSAATSIESMHFSLDPRPHPPHSISRHNLHVSRTNPALLLRPILSMLLDPSIRHAFLNYPLLTGTKRIHRSTALAYGCWLVLSGVRRCGETISNGRVETMTRPDSPPQTHFRRLQISSSFPPFLSLSLRTDFIM